MIDEKQKREIEAQLRAVVNTPANQIKAEHKSIVITIAKELGISVEAKPRCGSCWHDAAVKLFEQIQAEHAPEEQTEDKRKYVLKKGVDVYFGDVRVNSATLTDELARRILARGFERKFFARCE